MCGRGNPAGMIERVVGAGASNGSRRHREANWQGDRAGSSHAAGDVAGSSGSIPVALHRQAADGQSTEGLSCWIEGS